MRPLQAPSGYAADDPPGKQRINRGARKLTVGVLRPAIVLYDESHPLGDAIGDLQTYDLGRSPEILLIMGTSLKVSGLKQLVKSFARNIHDNPNPKHKGLVVFVNATKPGKEWDGIIDVHIQGESDRWVERVEEEWRRVKAADWEVQTTLDGPMLASGTEIEKVTQGKPSGMTKGKGKGRPKSKCESNSSENQSQQNSSPVDWQLTTFQQKARRIKLSSLLVNYRHLGLLCRPRSGRAQMLSTPGKCLARHPDTPRTRTIRTSFSLPPHRRPALLRPCRLQNDKPTCTLLSSHPAQPRRLERL